ncbi:class I SAM-dependent methyltransferase [Oxalobacteraceae bacterium A2-2]
MHDPSAGWESVAADFMAARSSIGAGVVRRWAACVRPGGEVVDIGCGSGVPVAVALVEQGLKVAGIDASPTLLSAFRARFPGAPAACEAAQDSALFGRKFDGAVAIGLLFLLAEQDQGKVIRSVGRALNPGGRFLFSAPRVPCAWNDLQTGRPSISLGEAGYQRLLAEAGMRLVDIHVDEGGNHYFDSTLAGQGGTAPQR